MRPKLPESLFKQTAENLNLPQKYIEDLVTFYYKYNLDRMRNLDFAVFTLTGLGRFMIRPFKFWRRESFLKKLLEEFKDRRDNRGIMIRKELEVRWEQMQNIKPKVQELFDEEERRRWKNKKVA